MAYESYQLYHDHPLSLMKGGSTSTVPCLVCWLDLSSPMLNCPYKQCSQDKFGLHTSCANLPATMDHPFHPQHTLTLLPKPPYDSGYFECDACGRRSWAFTFHCEECHFDLDAHCASLMPAESNGQEEDGDEDWEEEHQSQHHVGHPHPLIPCKKNPNSNVPCSGCNKQVKGRWIYVCLSCHFLMHKSCTELPSKIQHHIHPQHALTLLASPSSSDLSRCNACGNELKGRFAYYCAECKFGLDIGCASLVPAQDYEECQELQIQQLNHPHPLIRCENKVGFEFLCSGCNQPFKRQRIYVCLHCNCLLDESCSEWAQEVQHPFHPHHPLTLLIQPGCNSNWCRACGKGLQGLVLHCSECNFSLDLFCASLMPTQDPEHRELQIEKLGHPHPLILCKMKKDFHSSCHACQLSLGNFVCVCLECSLWLHRSCANLPREFYCPPYHKHSLTLLEHSHCHLEGASEINQLVWAAEMHPFHPQYNPILAESAFQWLEFGRDTTGEPNHKLDEFNGRYQCITCQKDTRGFAYACRDCSIYFDIGCVIRYQPHRHSVTLFNRKSDKLDCEICGRSLHTPFFRCEECNFNLHVGCVSILPQAVKHKSHRHPLTLTKSPVKDHPDEDENAEFYCDTCEEYRELSDTTYYCKKCHFVAHAHCVFAEALRVLVEERFLPFKLGEREDNAGKVVTKALMIEEIIEQEGLDLESHGRADEADQIASNSSKLIIELDEEIAVLRGHVQCLDTELRAAEGRKNEAERRLMELEERRIQQILGRN